MIIGQKYCHKKLNHRKRFATRKSLGWWKANHYGKAWSKEFQDFVMAKMGFERDGAFGAFTIAYKLKA